jgi:hypothetical protein
MPIINSCSLDARLTAIMIVVQAGRASPIIWEYAPWGNGHGYETRKTAQPGGQAPPAESPKKGSLAPAGCARTRADGGPNNLEPLTLRARIIIEMRFMRLVSKVATAWEERLSTRHRLAATP